METRLQEVASKIALLEKQLTDHFLTRQFNTSLFLKSKRVVDVSRTSYDYGKSRVRSDSLCQKETWISLKEKIRMHFARIVI